MQFKHLIAVFVGGGLGSVLRYVIGIKFPSNGLGFPYSTLLINLLACLIMGLLGGFLDSKFEVSGLVKTLLIVGFCGGFSTFSAFTAENIKLIETGSYLLAGLYIVLSIVFCLLVFWMGMRLGNKI